MTVCENSLLAAEDVLTPLESSRNAKVGRVVDGADELEVHRKSGTRGVGESGFGERRRNVPCARLETMGCGDGAADQCLVAKSDVQDGAAAGDKEPSAKGQCLLLWRYEVKVEGRDGC